MCIENHSQVWLNLNMKNFALIGANGYIAPRHLKAIADTKNDLVACADLNLNEKEIKKIFPNCNCFSDFNLFYEFISENKNNLDFIVICSPNFLHFEHCCLALELGINVICEKPITLNCKQLEILREYEKKYSAKVWSILQLRYHQSIKDLKDAYKELPENSKMEIDLTYITPRDETYLKTWKGDKSKSGGILFNIGLHFFDMLINVFGEPISSTVHLNNKYVLSGVIAFKSANVRWFMSILGKHSPYFGKKANATYRSITFDGKELNFSGGFDKLHTQSYEDILKNNGFGIDQNMPVMEMLEKINNTKPTKPKKVFHPFLENV